MMLNEKFLKRMKEYLDDEYDAFIASYNDDNIRGLRVNPNYIDEDEFSNIADFKHSKICGLENAFVVEEDLKFGFHPLHHAGAFYLQDPSAMLPAYSINVSKDAKVLDLCAAPGGKSTQIAVQIPNGELFANEIDNKRAWALYSNVERLGLSNVVISNNKPSDYLKNFNGYFDVILIDAPCSGEGMFRKYPESQELWNEDNVKLCANRDKEIVDVANELLKDEGIIIYSTCTFAKEENEDIVSYLMDKYQYETIPLKDELKQFVTKGFIDNTYRIYPHHHFGEGQFLAILKKNNPTVNNTKMNKYKNLPIEFDKFCKENLSKTPSNVILKNDELFSSATNADLSTLKILNYGVKLGKIINKRFVPEHHFYKAFSSMFVNSVDINYNDTNINRYLRGEELHLETPNGYGVLLVNNIPLGGYKASNNNLKNHYPKGLRNF